MQIAQNSQQHIQGEAAIRSMEKQRNDALNREVQKDAMLALLQDTLRRANEENEKLKAKVAELESKLAVLDAAERGN